MIGLVRSSSLFCVRRFHQNLMRVLLSVASISLLLIVNGCEVSTTARIQQGPTFSLDGVGGWHRSRFTVRRQAVRSLLPTTRSHRFGVFNRRMVSRIVFWSHARISCTAVCRRATSRRFPRVGVHLACPLGLCTISLPRLLAHRGHKDSFTWTRLGQSELKCLACVRALLSAM
jgi:hypothetical protein